MLSALLLLIFSLIGWHAYRARRDDPGAVIPLQLDLKIKIELVPPRQEPPEPKRVPREIFLRAKEGRNSDRWVN